MPQGRVEPLEIKDSPGDFEDTAAGSSSIISFEIICSAVALRKSLKRVSTPALRMCPTPREMGLRTPTSGVDEVP